MSARCHQATQQSSFHRLVSFDKCFYYVFELANVHTAYILTFREKLFSYHITNKYDRHSICFQLRPYFNDRNEAHPSIWQWNVITMMLMTFFFLSILGVCTPTTSTVTATCPGCLTGSEPDEAWLLSPSAWPPPTWGGSMSQMCKRKILSATVSSH